MKIYPHSPLPRDNRGSLDFSYVQSVRKFTGVNVLIAITSVKLATFGPLRYQC